MQLSFSSDSRRGDFVRAGLFLARFVVLYVAISLALSALAVHDPVIEGVVHGLAELAVSALVARWRRRGRDE